MIDEKMQNGENVISVQNLSKKFIIPHERINTLKGAFVNIFRKNSYESFFALDDVSFSIKKGEFFGIVGRNGSGKSTLLKILAGVYTADQGNVTIRGMISPFLELGIGFNPELSGRDNVYLNATVLGLSEKEIDQKFDSIVAFSELERFIDQKLKNYSSGMQVRLAFSVAIHANREILLLDEVLAVGDANFQAKCFSEFARYKELGKTVILVSHDTGIISRYCTRAILLRNGRIEKLGDAQDIVREYVYQNMSDEEKRIVKERDQLEEQKTTEIDIKKEDGKKINKIAEILNIEFYDKHGKQKNVFQTGDDILIRIYFKLNKEIKDINFGVGIYNEINTHVFGTGTLIDKVENKEILFQNGYAQIRLKNIQLKTGSYFIQAGLFGEINTIMHDFYPKSESFKVFGLKHTLGMVEMEHEWQ